MSASKDRLSIDNINLNLNFNQNNKCLIPSKNRLSIKSFNLQKVKTLLSINDAKILDIKKKKNLFSFHLVGEDDRYMQIENQIQNKILNMSMMIIKDYKFDPDLGESNQQFQLPRTKQKSVGNIEFIGRKLYDITSGNTKVHKNKKLKLNLKKPKPRTKLEIFKAIIMEKSRKIKRINNLYDSSGEDESDKEKEQSNYGISPRSLFIKIFDFFLLCSSWFYLFYMPYRLAKTKMIINEDEYAILFMIDFSEIIFALDLILGFFRWFYNNESKLENNGYMIVKNYLSNNFVFDFIMAIPFYTILRFQKTIELGYNAMYNEQFFLLKILMCLKAFKIFKLKKRKANRIIYFVHRIFAKKYLLERIYQIYNFILIICSIFNLIICIHIYISEKSYPNWIVSNNLQDKSFIEIYLASFYFIIATMTSVGYGDIVCISFEETCFQIILLSIGLVVYSWIISTVGDYVKNETRANISYNRDMAKLEEIRIAYPNMSFKLYNKIQQHIKRMLTQNKKYEYNILVNSLPYYLQNSLLLQIHKNEIDKFTFFKGCDNSDFILKVLTHLIPVFSKKNIVLVGEGELFEEMFFIKSGRLSMEAIIDLDNIEMSIEKYLRYRFEEIENFDNFFEKKNSFDKSGIWAKSFGKSRKSKSINIMGIINKQFENVEDVQSLHETDIEQEIGKCDFDVDIKDLYKGNIQYIRILDLLKNEYFGDIFMFLNIPNPLSLRVKSKRVELYILRKKDSFNIKKDYQNIWQRISKKSVHNIKSLKSLTLGIIKRYCEMNGLPIKGKETMKLKQKKMSINSWAKSINTNYFKTKKSSNTFNVSKKDLPKVQKFTVKSSFKNLNLKYEKHNLKENEKVTFNEKENVKPKRKIRFNLENESLDKNEKKRISKSVKQNRKVNRRILNDSLDISPLSDNESEKTKNKKLKDNINKILFTHIYKKHHTHKYNFPKTKSIYNKHNKNSTKIKNAINKDYMSDFTSLNDKYSEIKSRYSNKAQENSESNNRLMITGISNINELNSIYSDNFNHITKESTISFQIKSNYKNINVIAKGQYINDNKLKNLVRKIVKFYINKNSSPKKNNENKKFNYFKYFTNKLRKNKFRFDSVKLKNKNNKNNILEKFSITNEKENRNEIKNKTYDKFSQPSLDKNNIINYKTHNPIYNNKQEKKNPSSKKKYILDLEGYNKTINTTNQLNSNFRNKNKELLSESNNFNISNEPLTTNYINYENLRTLQNIKETTENNYKSNKNNKKKKTEENKPSNEINENKTGNNIHEVNLNYINNFCCIL